ncbi:uncharacterized protein LOC129895700 isoform X2 [Solanum dulcamara]|uniref:uncharacterized protein LOC129895700 isoform X2 n=1 Tax=Solanum dulcamara TaxID=45834 RepID=UPI002486B0D5|nr:uncharacterized protein LOC129895700 isoform X2 [Solanum dulcamara]
MLNDFEHKSVIRLFYHCYCFTSVDFILLFLLTIMLSPIVFLLLFGIMHLSEGLSELASLPPRGSDKMLFYSSKRDCNIPSSLEKLHNRFGCLLEDHLVSLNIKAQSGFSLTYSTFAG